MEINKTGNIGTQPLPPASPVGIQGGGVQAKTPVEATATPPVSQQPSQEQVQKALDSLKQIIEVAAPNGLEFAIDDNSGKPLVRVTDAKTGEMIRQIPSQELLEIARSLDKLQGLLFKQQA